MIKFDGAIEENTKEHNSYWPRIPNHPLVVVQAQEKQTHYLI